MEKNTDMDNRIVPASKKDVNQVAQLYDDLNDFLSAGTNYPGWIKGIYPVRETAEIAVWENSLFLMMIENDIAGSIILNYKPEEAYAHAPWHKNINQNESIVIHTLVVNPKYLRQGIAQKLLDYASCYASLQKAKSIRLDVSVHNTPAINLYEKCGYRYVATVDLGLPYQHLKWFKLYELVL